MPHTTETRQQVSDYYGRLLQSTADLKTNACCAAGAPPARIAAALQKVHPDVLARFYGCGFPIPEAVDGLRALDLGCGTGRDVFLLAQLVGPEGSVVGGNTASMLADTRLAPFFEVQGDREEHFGLFPCDPTLAAQIYGAPQNYGAPTTPTSSSCC